MADKERKKLFAGDEFVKRVKVGDELIFDKDGLKRLRVELVWAGTDLDVSAFLLDENNLMNDKSDLVFYNSNLRWKTDKPFNDPDFDPLQGRISESWRNSGFKNLRKWRENTLPISSDGSVIGSWDDRGDGAGAELDENGYPIGGEQMHILLDEVDMTKYTRIVLTATVAPDKIIEGETFADAHHPVVTIIDAETDKEIAAYELDAKFPDKDAVCFGALAFDDETEKWKFVPMADGYTGGIEYLAREVFN